MLYEVITQAQDALPGERRGTARVEGRGHLDQSAQFFGIKIAPIKSVADILQEANLRLSLRNNFV